MNYYKNLAKKFIIGAAVGAAAFGLGFLLGGWVLAVCVFLVFTCFGLFAGALSQASLQINETGVGGATIDGVPFEVYFAKKRAQEAKPAKTITPMRDSRPETTPSLSELATEPSQNEGFCARMTRCFRPSW